MALIFINAGSAITFLYHTRQKGTERAGSGITSDGRKIGQVPGKTNLAKSLFHRFCVAPMMEWTDRHCRLFHRLLTRRARLYTEMITTGAVLHGARARLMAHDPAEHPVALQLGGCDPQQLAECARIAEAFGY